MRPSAATSIAFLLLGELLCAAALLTLPNVPSPNEDDDEEEEDDNEDEKEDALPKEEPPKFILPSTLPVKETPRPRQQPRGQIQGEEVKVLQIKRTAKGDKKV